MATVRTGNKHKTEHGTVAEQQATVRRLSSTHHEVCSGGKTCVDGIRAPVSQRGPLVDAVLGVEKADGSSVRVHYRSTEAVSGSNVSHLATNQKTKRGSFRVRRMFGSAAAAEKKKNLLARSLKGGIAELILIRVVSPGSWIRHGKIIKLGAQF